MQGLRDIKGLLEIQDYSLYILIFLVVISLLIVFYVIKKLFFKKRVLNPKQLMQKELKSIDLNDTKNSAYTLTQAINILENQDYDELLKTLEKYKYKKEVMDFSEDEKQQIKLFVDNYNG